ncbi:MAG: superoxide dismutase [Candidatus Kerfeldbacteria bacterium]
MAYASLPKLEYPYDALEPHIDARTMEIHHTKHHQTYVDKLNAVMEKHPELADRPLEQVLMKLDSLDIPDADKTAIQNHGGGHLNHSLFWQIMGPEKTVDTKLQADIEATWQSLEVFKKEFSEKAAAHFGNGWMWLMRNASGSLDMHGLPNQDSPLLMGMTPVFCLDLWEHAYYLKYQSRRADYIAAWWNILKLLP